MPIKCFITGLPNNYCNLNLTFVYKWTLMKCLFKIDFRCVSSAACSPCTAANCTLSKPVMVLCPYQPSPSHISKQDSHWLREMRDAFSLADFFAAIERKQLCTLCLDQLISELCGRGFFSRHNYLTNIREGIKKIFSDHTRCFR